jgi:hypothetical protein
VIPHPDPIGNGRCDRSDARLAGVSAALPHAARVSRVGLLAASLDAMCVDVFVDTLVVLVEPVEIWFLWHPQLRDSGYELVLEAAVDGRAAAFATPIAAAFSP